MSTRRHEGTRERDAAGVDLESHHGDRVRAVVGDLEDVLQALQLEYDALENQIRVANPRYASLAGSQLLSVRDIQQKVLDANTAILMYSLGTEQSYLWVVTQQSIAVTRIAPRKVIEDEVQNLRSQLVPGLGLRGLTGIDLSSDATRSLDLGPDDQPPPRVNQAKDAETYASAANRLFERQKRMFHP